MRPEPAMPDRPRNFEDDETWVTATEQFGEAIVRARAGETHAALDLIDAILERCSDYSLAAQLGITLAARLDDGQRLIAYRSILLALQPHDTVNRTELARAMVGRIAFAAACDILERLPPSEVNAPDMIALRVRTAARLEDTSRLERVFARSAAPDLSESSAQYVDKVAATIAADGDAASAIAWLECHPELAAGDPMLQFRRATLLSALQRWSEADALFAALEGDHPSANRRSAATIFRARMARNAGDDGLARRLFAKVLATSPDHLEACDYLVRQYWAEGDGTAADSLIARFAAAAPDTPAAVWLKADALRRQGRELEALDVMRSGLSQHMADVDYLCRHADALAAAGMYDELNEVLDRATELEPASARVFSRRLAEARRRDRPPAELMALCEAFIVHEPANAEALLQRANCLLRLGRRVEAYSRYVEGARLNPGIANFWRAAAGLAVSINRQGEAAALAAEARPHFDEGDPAALCALAGIFEAADKTEAALALARRALEIDPDSDEAHATTARLLVSAGRCSAAWPHLRAAGAQAGRSHDTTRLFAQTVAGFRYLRPSQAALVEIEPIDGLFPETLFDRLAAHRPAEASPACEDLVLHVTSSLAAGGAERQVASTVAAMTRHVLDRRVELLVDDVDPATGRDVFLSVVEEAGVPVHVLRRLREAGAWRELIADEPRHAAAVRLIGSLPADMSRVALPMLVVFARLRPRVVHLWQDMIAVGGCLAAVLAGVPRIVLGTRSTRPVEPQRFRRYFHSAYSAFLTRPGVTMVNNSRNGARDYENWLGLPAGSVEVIYNGYDFARMRSRTDPARAAAARRQALIPADALVVGGVMRMSFEKRPDLWTEVVCKLADRSPRVHGLLVGEGPMRTEIEAYLAGRGLASRVRLIGQQSPIEPWMSAMDLLFLSSVTEGLPNVLIEAQALGVPVATMRVGGAPEAVVEGRTAVVAGEGEVAHIADVLASLLLDDARRAAFGRAGPEWAQSTFSTDAMLVRLAEIYERRP